MRNVFENYDRARFAKTNYYGIPNMKPSYTRPEGTKLIRFCDWHKAEDIENWICHFYYDDWRFINMWRNPQNYIKKLKRFRAVITPNFSLYTDHPRALQILSRYRNNWMGAYYQAYGIDCIPAVVWGDMLSYDYSFEGLPKGGTVAVSTVGVASDETWNNQEGELFMNGYNEMMNRLQPSCVIVYGAWIDGIYGDVVHVPYYFNEKREGRYGSRN